MMRRQRLVYEQSRVSFADVLVVLAVLLLLAAFFLTPWFHLQGRGVTALTLLTQVDFSQAGGITALVNGDLNASVFSFFIPRGIEVNRLTMLLIPAAALGGGALVAYSLITARRKPLPLGAMVAGLAGLAYFAYFLLQNRQGSIAGIDTVTIFLGGGFWLALFASLLLVAQAAVPRPIFEWWPYVILFVGEILVFAIIFDPKYRASLEFVLPGVGMTFFLTMVSFSIASTIGLFMGLARVSKNQMLYNISTFYVETIRGVPILVQLLYVAFVIFPVMVDVFTGLGVELSIRDVEMYVRAILGLSLAYGAFEAEVFRAGIESIERGQMEAARSLGMSYTQAMRYVILPQAIRRVLPPIGNDFVAMLKDTSLASVLAVREVTQLSNLHRSRTFTTFEPLNVATFLYLSMTLLLTRAVRFMERRLSTDA